MTEQIPAWQKAVFALLLAFCLSPLSSPPVSLAIGILTAFVFRRPMAGFSGRGAKYLLQASVILLGFGMDLSAIYRAGREGVWLTVATITVTLAAGALIGRVLRVDSKMVALISCGTSICGGSAIAAAAPAIRAEPRQIAVSLGIVFILNSVALFIFPPAGHLLGMTPDQFGIWSAVAIHDTSSVIGAAQAFSPESAGIAATVKLARALWIAPVALLLGRIFRRADGPAAKVAVPWFIFLFLAAAAIRTFAPAAVLPSIFDSFTNLAKAGMSATLFIIGAGLNPRTIRDVGFRPFLLGVTLWTLVVALSLVAIFGTR